MEKKTITNIARLRRSVNGNPRWRLTFDDGTVACTAPDAMCAFLVVAPDHEGRTVGVEINHMGRITALDYDR